MEGPTTFQQCTTFHSGVLSSVQHHLKKNHFHAFDALLDALQHRDVVGKTCIGRETLANAWLYGSLCDFRRVQVSFQLMSYEKSSFSLTFP